MQHPFKSIEEALLELRRGNMVILVDDESRENEGDLIVAAEKADHSVINFMATHGRGLICLSLTPHDFDRLQIPMMTSKNCTPYQTAFGISFEAATGISTGISAHDRAHTIKVAIDPHSGPSDIIMPGHMFPLKARERGVLERPGHTEGSVDLARLAGFKPAAVICEIMNADGSMARLDDLTQFSAQHNICLIRLKDLIDYRLQHEDLVTEVARAHLPLSATHGDFEMRVFQYALDSHEHVALLSRKKPDPENCLVRIHSECLTGDVFGSSRCDCGQQLQQALAEIEEHGGILLYLRQEGRGIGLANKIKAYALQDTGLDTVEANHQLGFAADERNYALAAQLLKKLDIKTVRLMTNNPNKIDALESYGIPVTQRVALHTKPHANNIDYLTTKREKLGHWLELQTEEKNSYEKC